MSVNVEHIGSKLVVDQPFPWPSNAEAWVERLRHARTKAEVLDAVLDLRDDAYDHPDAWERFNTVRLLHFLADGLEDTTEDSNNWGSLGFLLGHAVGVARSDVPSNWDA